MTFAIEATRVDSTDDEGISPYLILAILLRRRRMILVVAALGAIAGLVVATLRPPTYTSSFSFLPQSTQDPNRAGLATIAGQFGISLGALGASATPPQLYADLIMTREVLAPIAQSSVAVSDKRSPVPLSTFLEVGGGPPAVVADNTVRVLRKRVVAATVASRTTGMVTVRARTRDPKASFELAQRLLDGLNRFNLVTRQSQAHAERLFTESRYESARASLRVAEDALQHFLQMNRQYENSPALTFQRERLQRDVTLKQQLVTTLVQQYEDARIREVRDTPVITVIERATMPVRADPRLRGLFTVLGALIGFAMAGFYAVLREPRIPAMRDPDAGRLADEWKRFRGSPVS
jgi:tyrosine-protein kinase Etk/Wzc